MYYYNTINTIVLITNNYIQYYSSRNILNNFNLGNLNLYISF